jgi:CheY-like chemotaxis protein
MATYKIMLVEDDNNLRAIYGDRLMAEGYEIVSARDGEEALALAVKEKPHLIISDVMMPKISGFDMLDILRTTPETKDVKVIMMTALSQAEDKERADKLGADKYLVKSQVTLEDVARVVHEVLGDGEQTPVTEAAVAETPQVAAVLDSTPQVVPTPVLDANPFASNEPAESTPTVTANPFEAPPVSEPVAAPVPEPFSPPVMATTPTVESPVPAPISTQEPVAPQPQTYAAPSPSPMQPPAPTPTVMPDTGSTVATPPLDPVAMAPVDTAVTAPVVGDPQLQVSSAPTAPTNDATDEDATTSNDQSAGSKRVIQPLNDNLSPDATPKIYELYEKEMAAQAAMAAPVTSPEPSPVTAAPEQVTVQPAAGQQTTAAPSPQSPTTPGSSFDPNSVAL